MDVAKYIVTYCAENNNPVSNLKLQKMMYFFWIDYYMRTGTYLFDNKMCAWKFGPVAPEVYYAFSVYAGNPIVRKYENSISEKDKMILNEFIDLYMDVSVSELVKHSHRSGGAWDVVYNNGKGIRKDIPFTLIIEKEVLPNV
jgi:uncharacterized phage-associated protein